MSRLARRFRERNLRMEGWERSLFFQREVMRVGFLDDETSFKVLKQWGSTQCSFNDTL